MLGKLIAYLKYLSYQALSADNLREPGSKMSEHFVNGSMEQQGLLWIYPQLDLLPEVENAD